MDTVTSGDQIYINDSVIIAEDATSATYGVGAVYLDTTNGNHENYLTGANIFITGTVNGVSDGDGETLYLNAGTNGDIVIQGDVGVGAVLENIHIVNAHSVIFNGQVILTGDMIQSAGQHTTTFDVTAGGNITITTTGSITFGDDLEATNGNITLSTTNLISVTNDTRAPGGSLLIIQAKNASFGAAVTVHGSITQTAGTENTRFDGPVLAGSVNINVDEQIRFLNTLAVSNRTRSTLRAARPL